MLCFSGSWLIIFSSIRSMQKIQTYVHDWKKSVTNCLNSARVHRYMFYLLDDRLHHAAGHRLSVRTAQSLFTRRWWEPSGLHFSFQWVFVQLVNWHFTPSHKVRIYNKRHVYLFSYQKLWLFFFTVPIPNLMLNMSLFSSSHHSLKHLCLSFNLL